MSETSTETPTGTPTGAPSGTPSGTPRHDPFPNAGHHVLSRLGLGFDPEAGAEGARVTLAPDPLLIDDEGHLSFGALGVLFDMASSTALDTGEFLPFVHADITVHRLRPPAGATAATAHLARRGRRTAIAVVDLHDATGALVAASTQEIVFKGPPQQASPEMAKMRDSFRSMFDGTCRLTRPLEQELAISRPTPGTWAMELGPDRTNGFGGLHGGVATTLVDVAASGTVAEERGTRCRTVTVAARYLAPAMSGPFTATPRILADDGTVASLRVPVLDAEGTTVILADVLVGG